QLLLVLSTAATSPAPPPEPMGDRSTPNVRTRLQLGRRVLAEDYVRALAGRDVLRREVDAALAQHDALVLPTMPIPAPPIGASTVQVGTTAEPVRNMMLRLTQRFNVSGHPALAIPCGTTSAGLPCSVQLVGCRGQTDALLRLALACEPALSEPMRR